MKVTLDLADPQLYKAIKIEAVKHDRSLRDVVEEALAQWLERLEDEEDAAAAAAALDEYDRVGGRDATDVFQTLAAETRARYDADAS
ncbi:MAG: hypothetical protein ACRDF7_01910 [Candidatus Limnocylindrales bacterium]